MTRAALVIPLAVMLALARTAPVSAGPREDVETLVGSAVTYIQQHGREQAFADFSRPDGGFVEGALYIFCNDATGVVLAHGGNPKLVGKNLAGVSDVDGKFRTLEIFRLAQARGQGWIEYLWPNPVAGHVQRKASYVVRIDDNTSCASGYFVPGAG